MFLGPADEPRWARPGLWLLLAATAALYLWNLSASGYANDFYAAAVKAGTESWKAWLFGSLDSGNAITVDKPPGSLWVMVLSARIFGFSSFAMLLPQALLGVGTVAITWAAVSGWSGPAAGLVAGGLLALTPVAALMFRFNNPDAMLVFLMTAGRLLRGPRHRDRTRPDRAALVAVRRRGDRLRVPDQDAAGPAGAARVGAGLPDRRPVGTLDQDLASARRRWAR